MHLVAATVDDDPNPDLAGLKLWRVWTGQLESNALQMGDCPLEVSRER